MTPDDELRWDPYDSRFAADPWPLFNRMRTEAPLYRNEQHDFYALSRFGDVEAMLTDTETFSSARGVMLELIQANMEIPPGTLIMEDPPVHNIHRQLGAGNETTGRLIGWMGSTLAKFPDQRAEIAADASLVPGAVEETLRMEPPGPFTARYVTRDVEYYGQTVPAGSAMLGMLGAANRDPERFIDPDSFDMRRKKGLTLTFLLGPHYCLGSALARMEGRVALEEILKRWPAWEVDWDGAKMQQTSSVRGWEKLPLVVG